jgi:deoxyribodipyrimidine photo-lyase
MIRDKRVSDNFALLTAQNIAIKHKVPLLVCFQYTGNFPKANIRQYDFLFKGLEEVQHRLKKLNITFHLLNGNANQVIPSLIDQFSIGSMIIDYTPLKIYKKRIKRVFEKISIPVCQVDTHNIVPVWTSSNKKEYAAHTIRRKINNHLAEYLTDIPEIKKHPYLLNNEISDVNWVAIKDRLIIDPNVKTLDWIKPGEIEAKKRLGVLLTNLKDYHLRRNNPTLNALSHLSPYFHFGHISPQRVAIEITNSSLPKEDKETFLEEMIIRRELADNFCEYESRFDERDYVYSPQQFEEAETHDPLWNAAQFQMSSTGKMHGYMRMYWAKKILEWSSSPEEALQIAIDLNDKYELDGRDPSGYTGIAWSIGGIHDRAWFERPVYGKIRYMNYNGCKSKFDVKKYINRFSK